MSPNNQLMLSLAQEGSQRWRDRRHSFRPAGETINTRLYKVAPIHSDNTAKAFVVRHHYSSSYPAARFRYGLFKQGELQGVAVFSHPVNNRTITSVFPGEVLESVELGRFVLLDEVKANGESWFLARAFELLRKEGIRGVVSFSDPVPRTSLDGRLIFHGHIGRIYQATNSVYLGRGAGGNLHILPDGTVFNKRTIQKIRAKERGYVYATKLLEKYGAPPCPEDGHIQWLYNWLPRLTRRLHHRGNHKYAWTLTKRNKLPSTLPYPKQLDVDATIQLAA